MQPTFLLYHEIRTMNKISDRYVRFRSSYICEHVLKVLSVNHLMKVTVNQKEEKNMLSTICMKRD